jgi:hypothetical protein
MKYEDLKILDELFSKGSITREEYEREKAKILNSNDTCSSTVNTNPNALWGLNENTYIMLMHLSQFLGFVLFGLGFIVPIIMWVVNKDINKNVDKNGKNIVNFMISYFIYAGIAGLLILVVVGIPLLIAIILVEFIAIIIASIKANSGEYWEYPLTIKFFK